MSGDKQSDSEIAYDQVRQRIPDIIEKSPNFGDASYLRVWLKLGKNNASQTESLIRDAMKWRKERNTDDAIAEDFHPELAKELRMYFDGKTRNGFLAVSGNGGMYKFRNRIAKFGKEAVLHYWLQVIGKAEKLVIECNQRAVKNGVNLTELPNIQKSWLILNMKNLEYEDVLSKSAMSVVIQLVKMAAWYFPGLEGTLCVINANKFMEIILKAVKPLLRGSNIELLVFDTNEQKFKEAIHKYIDPSQLRTPFGGILDSFDDKPRDRA
ncbi:unnamed protein product [Allacma fusca]|uniref:CRAL-TRIO domain-containing protein n=1 Tax=Allacma fusca TaxID=39272 RepID=A0A8J2P8J3_9HEXA|nr:unnamed protein product [Allacma fusca]